VRKSEILYLDFYIPLNKKCIEVHGEQHYEFTPFYHANKLSFLKAQKRDKEKKEWCEINGITYVELPYNLINEWEHRIANN
jgi:very-short-patch-repair endonuclease